MDKDVEEKFITLKEAIYGILTAEYESEQIDATQNMGVNLTNAAKREGVTIVQIQSVINKKVLNQAVNALRAVDILQEYLAERVNTLTIDAREMVEIAQEPKGLLEYKGPIEVAWENQTSMQDFLRQMKKAYLDKAIKESGTVKAAADVLKLTRTYISKLKRT